MKTKLRGFTLIELMITVAIVGVLASIAYPSYSEHIRRSKQAEARAALTGFANAMEIWRMQHGNSYLGAAGTLATPTNTGSPQAGVFANKVPISGNGTKTYDLTIEAATATTYLLQATSMDGSPAETIRQDGTKSW
jgi:type IV pilus assembly protein PilE